MLVFVNYLDKSIGGVEQLIINVAIELAHKNERCKIYTSTVSYSYVTLTGLGIDFLHLDSDKIQLRQLAKYICGNDIVVLTNIYSYRLLRSLSSVNNRVVFYSVHPETFECNSRILNKIFPMARYKREYLSFMLQRKSLWFMCGATCQEVVDSGLEVSNAKYIPIPTIFYTGRKKNFDAWNKLIITYLGRGNADWKIFPIIKILSDLNCLSKNIDLEFHILTDSEILISQMISTFLPNNRVKIKFVIGLNTIDLENYLLENSDLHIAMGTSALEGGKLAIPTILIDGSHDVFPINYLYKWLYETNDYILGRMIGNTFNCNLGTTLVEKINIALNRNAWMEVSNRTYNYVLNNHSISNFVHLLQEAANETSLNTSEYVKLRYPRYVCEYKKMKCFISNIFNHEQKTY